MLLVVVDAESIFEKERLTGMRVLIYTHRKPLESSFHLPYAFLSFFLFSF